MSKKTNNSKKKKKTSTSDVRNEIVNNKITAYNTAIFIHQAGRIVFNLKPNCMVHNFFLMFYIPEQTNDSTIQTICNANIIILLWRGNFNLIFFIIIFSVE